MSAETFVPARYASLTDVVAVGRAGFKTYADLLRDVGSVVSLIQQWDPPLGDCLMLCRDRYHLAVGALAAWEDRRGIVLPPNFQPETLRALRRGPTALLFTDEPRNDSNSEVDIPRCFGVRGGAGSLTPLPADRVLGYLSTSGTTGQAKACEKTAAQLLGEARDAAVLFGLTGLDVVLSTTPSHHIYGFLFGVLAPLAAGATFSRDTPFHAADVRRAIKHYGATALVSVPPHLAALVDLDDAAAPSTQPPQVASSLRKVFSSAAPLAASVANKLLAAHDAELIELLGSTETGGIAYQRNQGQKRGAAWRPLPRVRVQTGPDELLELHSPYAPTAPYIGGDRIGLHADGTFTHLGRTDGVVKVAGKRVSLQHLEQVALQLDGVEAAAAVVVEVPGLRGVQIWLAVVSTKVTAEEVRQTLALHFDTVVGPRRIIVVDRLPQGENGKLPRSAMLTLFETHRT